MKTHKIIEEAQYMLTEETRKDERLNPIDLNVLAVCQYVANYKQLDYDKDGWFILPIAERDKIKATSIQGYLSKWGVKVSDDTVGRSVNKLMYLRYLEFKKGYYHSPAHSQLSEIKILKGTIPMLMSSSNGIDASVTDSCGIVAVATDTEIESKTNTKTETKLETHPEIGETKTESIADNYSTTLLGANLLSSTKVKEGTIANGGEDWIEDADPTERRLKVVKDEIKKGVFCSETALLTRIRFDSLNGYEEVLLDLYKHTTPIDLG